MSFRAVIGQQKLKCKPIFITEAVGFGTDDGVSFHEVVDVPFALW